MTIGVQGGLPASLQRQARIPGANHFSGLIGGDNRSCGNDRLLADGHTRSDQTLGANPSPVLDEDRRVSVPHVRTAIVMIAGAQKRALRNAAVRADGYAFQIQDKGLFANPSKVANG
jgi:hypothetical protein